MCTMYIVQHTMYITNIRENDPVKGKRGKEERIKIKKKNIEKNFCDLDYTQWYAIDLSYFALDICVIETETGRKKKRNR